MDIARSIQAVTEEVVLRLAHTIHKELKADYLTMVEASLLIVHPTVAWHGGSL